MRSTTARPNVVVWAARLGVVEGECFRLVVTSSQAGWCRNIWKLLGGKRKRARSPFDGHGQRWVGLQLWVAVEGSKSWQRWGAGGGEVVGV